MVLLKLWKAENGPWMQALHGIFGVGALLAPLLAEPFLRAGHSMTNSTIVMSTTTQTSANLYNEITLQVSTRESSSFNSTLSDSDGDPKEESIVHWVYLILAIGAFVSAFLLLSIAIFCSEIKIQCRNKPRANLEIRTLTEDEREKDSRSFRIQIIILVFFFYLLYCILEMNFGNYLTVFAVEELGWSEKEGARVTAGYWTTFTIGRILGIFLVKLLSPWIMLSGSLVIAVIFMGVLLFLFRSSDMVLWVCSLSLGAGVSTMYATGITWTEQYISMNGPVGATFMVGSSIGEMTGPVIIGFLFDNYGPTSFLYVMFCAICGLGLLFIVMQCHAKRHGKRPRKHTTLEEHIKLNDSPKELN